MIYSFTYQWTFGPFAITNRLTMNILVYISWCIYTHFLLGFIPGNGISGTFSIYIVIEYYKLVVKVVMLFDTPSRTVNAFVRLFNFGV